MSPCDRYKNLEEVKDEILKLNLISNENPMNDFWSGAVKVGIAVGIIYVLAKIFGD